MIQDPAEKIPFGHCDFSARLKTWVFCTDEPHPVREFTGKTVNFGDKDGGVYDSTVITGIDEQHGKITIEGGRYQRHWMDDGETEPITTMSICIWDIARGYVHPGQEQQS